MRVFICWLISMSDWVGELSLFYVFLVFGGADGIKPEYAFIAEMIPPDIHFLIAGSVMAIIPAIITAIYGTINYDLVLSWAIVRWMSPLNIFTNQVFYFFKTLFLSGAAWAALFTYLTYKFFPNANLEWFTNFAKTLFNYLFPN